MALKKSWHEKKNVRTFCNVVLNMAPKFESNPKVISWSNNSNCKLKKDCFAGGSAGDVMLVTAWVIARVRTKSQASKPVTGFQMPTNNQLANPFSSHGRVLHRKPRCELSNPWSKPSNQPWNFSGLHPMFDYTLSWKLKLIAARRVIHQSGASIRQLACRWKKSSLWSAFLK